MDCPECERFEGIYRDLCCGVAIVNGHPVHPAIVAHWRHSQGLPYDGELPVAVDSESRPVIIEKAPNAMGEAGGHVQKRLSPEPVGTVLKSLLIDCGVSVPVCGSCTEWAEQMDAWQIAGCQENRDAICKRLKEAASGAGWLAMAKVAANGYFTVGALLDEAIRRTAEKLSAE